MRALIVVEANPVANDPAGMLQVFEAVAMNALRFQSPDHPFHQAVLLGRVRRDEFLLQSIV